MCYGFTYPIANPDTATIQDGDELHRCMDGMYRTAEAKQRWENEIRRLIYEASLN
jgi:hypothetical protein